MDAMTYSWTDPDKNWEDAKHIVAGIDVGSVDSKAVLLADSELLCYGVSRTGSNSSNSARIALDTAIGDLAITPEKIHFTIGTGYGRANVPFADKVITEISCHARGVNYMVGPTVRTVLDMGGQDCKVIRCNEKGKVIEFLMNDKCAAGTGRGLEIIADYLKMPLTETGDASFNIKDKPPKISNTCVVFARSEFKGLMLKGYPKNALLAGYMESVSDRVLGLIRRLELKKEFVISGGIAKNIGIVKRIEERLGLKALEAKPDPIIAGALGAALFAHDFLMRSESKKNRVG
jgi:bzd-type benzoyl-CoA reductase Q subunit